MKELKAIHTYYNTILSYGLTEEEAKYVDDALEKYNENYPDPVSKLYHFICDDINDLVEIPSYLILVRFDIFDKIDLEIFNEVFDKTKVSILAMDKFPIDATFSYYPCLDLSTSRFSQLLASV